MSVQSFFISSHLFVNRERSVLYFSIAVWGGEKRMVKTVIGKLIHYFETKNLNISGCLTERATAANCHESSERLLWQQNGISRNTHTVPYGSQTCNKLTTTQKKHIIRYTQQRRQKLNYHNLCFTIVMLMLGHCVKKSPLWGGLYKRFDT